MSKLTKTQVKWLDIIRKAGGLIKHYNQLGNEAYFVLDTGKIPDVGMVSRMLRGGGADSCGRWHVWR